MTIQLSVNFVKAVHLGETVIAKGIMQHLGRHTVVSRAEAHTQDGVLVGTASATFLYVTHGSDASISLSASPPLPPEEER